MAALQRSTPLPCCAESRSTDTGVGCARPLRQGSASRDHPGAGSLPRQAPSCTVSYTAAGSAPDKPDPFIHANRVPCCPSEKAPSDSLLLSNPHFNPTSTSPLLRRHLALLTHCPTRAADTGAHIVCVRGQRRGRALSGSVERWRRSPTSGFRSQRLVDRTALDALGGASLTPRPGRAGGAALCEAAVDLGVGPSAPLGDLAVAVAEAEQQQGGAVVGLERVEGVEEGGDILAALDALGGAGTLAERHDAGLARPDPSVVVSSSGASRAARAERAQAQCLTASISQRRACSPFTPS